MLSKGTVLLVLVVLLALIGGLLKIIGGLLYGSRSLLVDALTSFANIAALLFTLYYYRLSTMPPDTDHPFGHYRLGVGGKIAVMISYSFVAGIAISELLTSTHYTVSLYSVYFALLGFIVYLGVIYVARLIGGIFKTYSAFTVSELIESIVVILAALGGAVISYLIDYTGAILLTLYIFYEIKETFSEAIVIISDTAPSSDLIRRINEVVGKYGLKVIRSRIRFLEPGRYHGDIKVSIPRDINIDELIKILRSLKKELYEELGVDASIEIDF
ncbi:MAG TPA: cation transporter [Ignisphaera sp.]|nr:cation transporter [Ignisphaera sp.]